MSNEETKQAQQVRIKMTGHGRGEVYINAMRVRGVHSIRFSAGVDCMNSLELVLCADNVELEGQMLCDVSDIGSKAREVLRVVVPQPQESLTAAAIRHYGAESAEAKYWAEVEAQAERLAAEQKG